MPVLEIHDLSRADADQAAAEAWFAENDPEGVAFEYDVISTLTAGEAHYQFQLKLAHILVELKRKQ